MNEVLAAIALVTDTMRTMLLVGGVVFAGVATVDWAVRTRRINPFNGVARFMRARVDPRLAGVERPSVRWRYRAGPTFDNSVGIIELDGRWAGVTIYRAEPGEAATSLQPLHTRELASGDRSEIQERTEFGSR